MSLKTITVSVTLTTDYMNSTRKAIFVESSLDSGTARNQFVLQISL